MKQRLPLLSFRIQVAIIELLFRTDLIGRLVVCSQIIRILLTEKGPSLIIQVCALVISLLALLVILDQAVAVIDWLHLLWECSIIVICQYGAVLILPGSVRLQTSLPVTLLSLLRPPGAGKITGASSVIAPLVFSHGSNTGCGDLITGDLRPILIQPDPDRPHQDPLPSLSIRFCDIGHTGIRVHQGIPVPIRIQMVHAGLLAHSQDFIHWGIRNLCKITACDLQIGCSIPKGIHGQFPVCFRIILPV